MVFILFFFVCFFISFLSYESRAASAFIFYLDCISAIHNTVNIAIVYRLLQSSWMVQLLSQLKKREKNNNVNRALCAVIFWSTITTREKNGQCLRKCNALISFTVSFYSLSLFCCYCCNFLLYSKIQGYYYWMVSWKKTRRRRKKIIRFIEKECTERKECNFLLFSSPMYSIILFSSTKVLLIHSLFFFTFILFSFHFIFFAFNDQMNNFIHYFIQWAI